MENKPKYTPGPWKAHSDDGTGIMPCVLSEKINNGGNWYVAQCISRNYSDAALIAAAPELLEALKKLEARVDWFLSEDFGRALGINYNPLSQEFFDLEQARAAIAKAEGK